MMLPWTQQPRGIRLIVGYKFIKAAVVLSLAIWLTCTPAHAYRIAVNGVRELGECGGGCLRVAHWLNMHLTGRTVLGATVLAWFDAVSSAIEGILLLNGKPWGQWLVVAGSAALLPFEAWSSWHRPRPGMLLILAVNSLIVAYLIRTRARKQWPE
jgi:hypothetical protein